MINKDELKSAMAKYGDTQTALANAMGISLSRLNAKINETNGASFWQTEIAFIQLRYNLNAKQLKEIFFNQKVS